MSVVSGCRSRRRRLDSDGSTQCTPLHDFEYRENEAVTCVTPVLPPTCELPFPSLLTGGAAGSLRVFKCWNGHPTLPLRSASLAHPITPTAAVTALLLLPRRGFVWCGDASGAVYVQRLPSNGVALDKPIFTSGGVGHGGAAITSLVTSYDEALVCSGDAKGCIASWTSEEPIAYIASIGQHYGSVAQMAFIRNGYLATVGPFSSVVCIWRVSCNGEELAEGTKNSYALIGHTGGVLCCSCVEKHASQLWSGGEDGFIRVWNLSDPRHRSCSIPTSPACSTSEGQTNEMREELDEDDEEDIDNAMRILAGHKASVIALQEHRGLVFSCDASGTMLAWNAERQWLLHAFRLTTPGEDLNCISNAQCLGFTEGFFWAIQSQSGPHCVFVPNPPHPRRSLGAEVDVERIDDRVLLHSVGTYMRGVMDLVVYCTAQHCEVYHNAMSINAQLKQQQQQQQQEKSKRSHGKENLVNIPTTSPLERECETVRVEALDRLRLEMQKTQAHHQKERQELLRTIARLRNREAEREQHLARVNAQLSFMRIKYGDWDEYVKEK